MAGNNENGRFAMGKSPAKKVGGPITEMPSNRDVIPVTAPKI